MAEWLPAEGLFARDATVAHRGHASARISATGGDASGCPGFYLTPIAAIEPVQAYTASAWARQRGATGTTRVDLSWFGPTGRFVAQSSSSPLPEPSSGWTQLRVSSRPPPGAAYAQIYLTSCDNAGTAWFDDVAFAPAR